MKMLFSGLMILGVLNYVVMGEGMPKDAASFKKKATKMKKAAEN
jgi:hypothetical protein